jgi:hypothetical protein
MSLRLSAEEAGWSIRERAWDLEERVLWRGSDRLQRLIQTRLTWPLSDALHERSARTRGLIAAAVAAAAIAGAAGGALSAADHPAASHAVPPAASVSRAPASPHAVALQGVTPQFQPGHAPPAPPPQPPPKTAAPPQQVAWQFAQAFVAYEVGRSSKKTNAAFATTATKQLAKSLSTDPPRLPAGGKVPKARVLNVVLGTPTKNQVTASVSLVRLRAISEVRLTLTKTGDVWRVAQVLG